MAKGPYHDRAYQVAEAVVDGGDINALLRATFPEITSGDVSPHQQALLTDAIAMYVAEWAYANAEDDEPTPDPTITHPAGDGFATENPYARECGRAGCNAPHRYFREGWGFLCETHLAEVERVEARNREHEARLAAGRAED